MEVVSLVTTGGIFIRTSSDGNLFNLRWLQASTKTQQIRLQELLFADDAALVAHSENDLQSLVNRFAKTASSVGPAVNARKTEVMFQPAPGTLYTAPSILIDDQPLKLLWNSRTLAARLQMITA